MSAMESADPICPFEAAKAASRIRTRILVANTCVLMTSSPFLFAVDVVTCHVSAD